MCASLSHTLPIKDGENEGEVKNRDESKDDANVLGDNNKCVKS